LKKSGTLTFLRIFTTPPPLVLEGTVLAALFILNEIVCVVIILGIGSIDFFRVYEKELFELLLVMQSRDSILHIFKTDVGVHVRSGRGGGVP
jgi:hypothetical protein